MGGGGPVPLGLVLPPGTVRLWLQQGCAPVAGGASSLLGEPPLGWFVTRQLPAVRLLTSISTTPGCLYSYLSVPVRLPPACLTSGEMRWQCNRAPILREDNPGRARLRTLPTTRGAGIPSYR